MSGKVIALESDDDWTIVSTEKSADKSFYQSDYKSDEPKLPSLKMRRPGEKDKKHVGAQQKVMNYCKFIYQVAETLIKKE